MNPKVVLTAGVPAEASLICSGAAPDSALIKLDIVSTGSRRTRMISPHCLRFRLNIRHARKKDISTLLFSVCCC